MEIVIAFLVGVIAGFFVGKKHGAKLANIEAQIKKRFEG